MKNSTYRDYILQIYKVIAYIESKPLEKHTLESLSKVAGFSKYHFHRIFCTIMGENVGAYIKRVHLQSSRLKTDEKITDIALSSGYETNAAFSAAFKKLFGVSPTAFAKEAKVRVCKDRLKPTIVEFEGADLIYVRKVGEYNSVSEEAWDVLLEFAHKHTLINENTKMFGFGHDDPDITDTHQLRYDAAMSYFETNVKIEGEILRKNIEPCRCAMFLHVGLYEDIDTTYNKIGDWIVQSGVYIQNQSMFEIYLNQDAKPEDLKTQIYLPLQ